MKKIAILLVLFAFAACASDHDKEAGDKDKHAPDKVAEAKLNTNDLICPQVAILTNAEDHSDYGGESPDPSQLVAAAHMLRVSGDCGYTEKGIDVSYTLHMFAARGPRLGGNQASFPFFIAVVDASDNILSRQLMTAKFSFSGNDARTKDDEALHIFIPLPKEAIQGGPGYRVLMGFQK